jgi:hypothetical protein
MMNVTQQVAWQSVVKNPELWSAFVEFCNRQAEASLLQQDEEALNLDSTRTFEDRVLRIIQLTAERRVYSELCQRFLNEIHKGSEP